MPLRTFHWESAYEYLIAAGKTICAENYKSLRESFSRIAGLSITLQREDQEGELGLHSAFLPKWHLPPSVGGNLRRGDGESETRYFVALGEEFFEHAEDYFVAIPLAVWQLSKRRPLQGPLLIWLFKRAHTAASPSVVTWDLLREQFGLTDTNRERIKHVVENAVRILRVMWPGCAVDVLSEGVRFARSKSPFLQRI
jgi:hypothetical protein